MRKPITKNTCLQLAQFNFQNGNEDAGWQYLVCWAFYEMYIDGHWQE